MAGGKGGKGAQAFGAPRVAVGEREAVFEPCGVVGPFLTRIVSGFYHSLP